MNLPKLTLQKHVVLTSCCLVESCKTSDKICTISNKHLSVDTRLSNQIKSETYFNNHWTTFLGQSSLSNNYSCKGGRVKKEAIGKISKCASELASKHFLGIFLRYRKNIPRCVDILISRLFLLILRSYYSQD